MSPEQCRARPVDRRSDVFALGSILYELTTGTAPFAGASDLDILNQIATGKATPPVWPDSARRLPAGAVGDRDARAGAGADDRFPSMQALQSRAGIVRARRGHRAVDDGAGVVRPGAVRRGAGGVARGAARGQVAGRAPGGAAGGGAAARKRGTHRAPTRSRLRRAPLQQRGRWRRFAAVASFVVVCAVAGGHRDQGVDASGGAGSRPVAARRRDVAGRQRRCREGNRCRPTTLPAPGAAARSPRCRWPPRRRRPRPRSGKPAGKPRATPAGEAKGQPATADSRLGAWDPDSPVPP